MRKLINSAFKHRPIKATGLLVPSPITLRKNNIEFMLIGEDNVEYHLLANKKTMQMWYLLETKVRVKAYLKYKSDKECVISVLSYSCLDNFNKNEQTTIDKLDDQEFDAKRFDFAI
jgi:hypothetical protein